MTPVQAADAFLEAGVRILQYRNKGFFSRTAFDEACEIARMCHHAHALFIINDRADMAALCGASGVHLGQDDLAPTDARQVLPAGAICGLSTHNEAQFRQATAEPVDYLALGPIFGTGSKANPDPVVGIAELHRLRPLTPRPLVAIGGITRSNASEVWAAGANSVAVISDAFPVEANPSSLRARAQEWLQLAAPQRNCYHE